MAGALHGAACRNPTQALLSGPGKASDKFWELEKRLRKDKKRVGVVADVSRSEMYYNLLYLLDDKTITLEDLAGFSPDLREPGWP